MPGTIDFNECFRTGENRRTVAEAFAQFDAGLGPIAGIERVALRDGLGRILAEDLVARHDIPPYDNSAMDGYVVYFDDLPLGGETRLPVVARIAAGHPSDTPLARGHAAQIFTGAPLPAGVGGIGPDTIFMVEDCRLDGDHVIVPSGIARGANRRRTGEDVKRGDAVLRAGRRLRPQDIAMIAALGLTEIAVYRRLHVAVFSTGDEVREPGRPLEAGAIFDTNRYALMSMLDRLGCNVTDLGILPDQPIATRAAIAAASDGHDLLLTSGGVSQGGEDHVREAVSELGAVNFWSLAMKPGRIVALGHVQTASRAVPFIGLPGNPVAVIVTFLTIARPIVLRLAGAIAGAPVAFRVRAGFDFIKKPGRREWIRARLVPSPDGPVAEKFSEDGSGILTSMVATDGLIELAEETVGVRRGDMIDFLPYAELMS
jgi:molybdopterin molybdotransferase